MIGARGTQKGTAAANAAAAIRCRVRVVAVIATTVALAGVLAALPASASAASPITETFSDTGGVQTFTEPNGVTPSPGASAAATRQRACPTFRVVRPDPAAGYRAGIYDVSVSGPIGCRGALRLFRRYLADPRSRLPRGWRHRRHYAGFANRRAAFNVYRPLRRTTHHRYGAVRLCHPTASVFPTERVGFRPGHHALLAWGGTRCARARAVFRSYARRGVVPAPYRLDRHRTAFSVRAVRGRSRERRPEQAVGAPREARARPVEGAPGVGQPRSPAGPSGFEVAYRDYALRDPQPGSPDPNDQCAKGEFNFYICGGLENRLEGITLANASESHSCGSIDAQPAQTLPPFTSTTWRVNCAVGFWGSVTYDIIYQGSDDGDLEVSYSTFDGTYTCRAVDSTLVFGCTSGDMLPENGNATWENWHYLFFATAG